MVRQLRTWVIGVILLSVLALLQYRLWFQPGGVQNMRLLKNQLAQQTIENEKLKLRNEELLSQIERLQNSKEAAESRARNELGMIKKDETFYQVVH